MRAVSLLPTLCFALLCAPALAEDAFTLESDTVSGGDTVTLKFTQPLPAESKRHWVCLVKKGESDSAYGVWSYVDVGATSATLKAPEVDGDYEVRLHSNYPDKSYNVVHRVALKISGLTPTKPEDCKLALPSASIAVDQPISVKFKATLVPQAKEKFWVCVVPAGAPPEAKGLWAMVPIPGEGVKLPAATSSGKHEVRLHGNYPTKTTHVIDSAPLEVTGAEDTLPSDPSAIGASLAATSIAHGSKPTVEFGIPLRPITGEKFWVGIAHSDVPETSQGLYKYVKPGATSIELAAPLCTGKHRIQVYANYPTKSRNAVATLELDVTGPADKAPTDPSSITLKLDSDTIAAGAAPKVSFGKALHARTAEKYWITVIEAEKGDSEWGQYKYLPAGASSIELAAPKTAGAYEVRLHANYPTKSSNLVARTKLTVE